MRAWSAGPRRGSAHLAYTGPAVPEYAPLIGRAGAPFWLLCPVRSQSLLFTWLDKEVSAVLRVVDCVTFTLRDVCCYDESADMLRKRPVMSDVEPSDSESSYSGSEAGDPPASATQSTGAPVADLVPATAGQDPVVSAGRPSDAPVRGGVMAGGRQLRRRGCKTTPLNLSTCPVPVGCVITPTFSLRGKA